MFVCLTIVVLVLSVVVEATNIKAHFPEPKNGKFPRLRLQSTLPNLKELTACFWVNISSINGSEHSRTILSYATQRDHNEFLILLMYQNGKAVLRVERFNEYYAIDCSTNCKIGSWCHICLSWFDYRDRGRRVRAFVDGDSCKDRFFHYSGYIATGGVLVIGQEQDDLDSNYEVRQAWVGDIADLQLWDKVLSKDEILEAGICGGKKRNRGNIVSWLDTPMVATDGVVLSSTQLCLP